MQTNTTTPWLTIVLNTAIEQTPEGWRHGIRPAVAARFRALVDALQLNEAEGVRLVEAEPFDEAALGAFHTPAYLDTIQALTEEGASLLDETAYGLDDAQVPIFPDMHDYFSAHVATLLTAARHIAQGHTRHALTAAGGAHHPRPAEARGLSLYNDIALALHVLAEYGQRVLYLNLDAHHPDAVQETFWHTDRVVVLSVHEGGDFLFPGTGEPDEIGAGPGKGATINLPLPPLADDTHLERLTTEVILPVVKRFAPDVVLLQIGADIHPADDVAHLRLTTNGLDTLFEALTPFVPHWLVVGGEGTDPSVLPRFLLVAAAHLAETITLPDELPNAYASVWEGGPIRDEPVAALPASYATYVDAYLQARLQRLQDALGDTIPLAISFEQRTEAAPETFSRWQGLTEYTTTLPDVQVPQSVVERIAQDEAAAQQQQSAPSEAREAPSPPASPTSPRKKRRRGGKRRRSHKKSAGTSKSSVQKGQSSSKKRGKRGSSRRKRKK
nr:hypothetical protein [Ardenticatena sp.]